MTARCARDDLHVIEAQRDHEGPRQRAFVIPSSAIMRAWNTTSR
jgi:hypothetical protein